MIRTADEALELVRRHQVVTMTSVEGFRSLVAEIAGGPVRGSWWGHPKGSLMYELANGLHDSREVVAAKWIDGKVTFVHRSLWPALYRVATSPDRDLGKFDALERRILAAVEKSGEMEADRLLPPGTDRRRFKKAIERLAQRMALLTGNVHTEKGSHATILMSWRRWASASVRCEARAVPLEEAVETLRRATGGTLYGLS
jgi:hypothetical protein